MSDYLDSLFGLTGKTVLVTGGAKGIGRMLSEALLQAGARVYISSRSAGDCAAAAAEMSQYGDCRALAYDLSQVANIEALAADLEATGHGLDVLVNNSGVTWGAALDEFPESGWDKVMNLNVKSPFFLVQKLLPLLAQGASAESPARVVNIGSVAGEMATSQSAYSYMASKAALMHLTRGLAKDLASRHITVNAIAPGFFESKMTRHFSASHDMLDAVLAGIPLGRMGQPREIGALALYLCGPAGAYTTGAVMPVSGGVELA